VAPAGAAQRFNRVVAFLRNYGRAQVAFEDRSLEVFLIALDPVLPVSRLELLGHVPDHFIQPKLLADRLERNEIANTKLMCHQVPFRCRLVPQQVVGPTFIHPARAGHGRCRERIAGCAAEGLSEPTRLRGVSRRSGVQPMSVQPINENRNRFAQALGEAVLECWGDLPQGVQQALFEKAVVCGHHDEGDESLRAQLAEYLHDHHPRTAAASA